MDKKIKKSNRKLRDKSYQQTIGDGRETASNEDKVEIGDLSERKC